MASDPDACLPQQVTDFVFDLSDSVTLSQITEEQTKLYNVTFRELCTKYFASSPWPSPQSIASECNGNPLFLAIYREVTHRHWHSVSRPTVRDRLEGWNVYRELFDELLDEENVTASEPPFFLLPDWTFDILHEFVYQFQGFCQFRAAVKSSADKHHVDMDNPAASAGNVPHHLIENLTIITQNPDAWGVEAVTMYLSRLISVGKTAPATMPVYQYLGIFASIALSRLECLLGDYYGCLLAGSAVMNTETTVTTRDGETHNSLDIVQNVFPARISWAYHAGVAYLMLRRYKDATRLLGDICSYMQRGFKTGQLRKLPGSDQFNKNYDRMVALLAILTHVCPPTGLVEEPLLKAIREKHGSQLSKIDSGEEGYEDLFVFACPKFISPGGDGDAYKLQIRQFGKEMESQHASRKLRSYMKLYTSIAVSKLAAFNDMEKEEFLPLLLSYKHRMRQLEEDGNYKSALDIHYYLTNDVIHVDEAEKQRRFENYFLAQIAQNAETMKGIEAISTEV